MELKLNSLPRAEVRLKYSSLTGHSRVFAREYSFELLENRFFTYLDEYVTRLKRSDDYLKSALPLLALAVLGSTPVIRRSAIRLERSRPRWFFVAEIVLFAAALLLCAAGMVSSTYSSFLYAQF